MSGANDGMIEPLIDLQRLAAGIRWRRRMWGALALAGLLAGILAAIVLPGKATASAQIYVVHQTEDSGDPTATTKTDLALLKSTTVAAEAIARSPVGEPAEDYVGEYSGEVVAANVLRVTAPGDDREKAVANARALADAFVAVYVRQSDGRAQAEAQALDDRRRAVQRELAGLGPSPDQTGVSGAAAPGVAERAAGLNAQLSAIEQLAVQAEIGTPQIAAGTTVIDVARVTSHSPLFYAGLYGLIGLLVGLGGGLGLAAVLTVARDRPVLRRDIGAHLGASVIAQIPAPAVGRFRLPLRRKGRARAESERVAAILARLVRHGGPVSMLELGCPRATADLARATAGELAADSPVEIVDDLPGGMPAEVADSPADSAAEPAADAATDAATGSVRVVDGASFPPAEDTSDVRRLGVGSVGPGASWTDLRRLGAETILVVRAGSAEASWMHTVARQLADEGIAVVGVVVVHPDPRDRSDGTLWDPLHTAVRGRVAAGSGSVHTGPAVPEAAAPSTVPPSAPRATEPPLGPVAVGVAAFASIGAGGDEPADARARALRFGTPTAPRVPSNGNGHGNGTGHGNGAGHAHGNGHAGENGHTGGNGRSGGNGHAGENGHGSAGAGATGDGDADPPTTVAAGGGDAPTGGGGAAGSAGAAESGGAAGTARAGRGTQGGGNRRGSRRTRSRANTRNNGAAKPTRASGDEPTRPEKDG